MKIGVISDIHLDINQDFDVLASLDRIANQEGCDLVLIAGDIHSNAHETIRAMAQLNQQSKVNYKYVPGNHDLWNDHIDLDDTNEIYKLFLQDENCLCERPLVLGDWVVVGDIGWYDYSFGNKEKFSFADFEKMQLDGRVWQDSIKNQWTVDNAKRTEQSLQQVEALFAEYGDKKKILVTHMIPVHEFCVDESKANWAYFNAFLGSERYGLYRGAT